MTHGVFDTVFWGRRGLGHSVTEDWVFCSEWVGKLLGFIDVPWVVSSLVNVVDLFGVWVLACVMSGKFCGVLA